MYIYLFIHGIFIGTAVMSSSSLGGTFVLACTVSFVHGIYLERHINVDVADNRRHSSGFVVCYMFQVERLPH